MGQINITNATAVYCCWLLLWYVKARARIELREEATEQDARDVIEIMKYRSSQFVCTVFIHTQCNCSVTASDAYLTLVFCDCVNLLILNNEKKTKNWVVECWHGYLSGARCRFAYGPADAATALHYLWDWFYLPGFTFLVPAYPGGTGRSPESRETVVVVVVVVVILHVYF